MKPSSLAKLRSATTARWTYIEWQEPTNSDGALSAKSS